jgi:hypothetical protein
MKKYFVTGLCISFLNSCVTADNQPRFEGKYYSGQGDVEYVELLDSARRMFDPDPYLPNIAMFYKPQWNGFVLSPNWGMWWVQNTYGTTYCALPFYMEPYTTYLQNAQDLWYKWMGDGKTEYVFRDWKWTPPDGSLVDCAAIDGAIHKQGDGRADIHDWPMEFTAAGSVMQAELLLIGRDKQAIAEYLPKIERSINLIESRRDPKNNLFLVGAAGNLLAPSYAGWQKADGSFDKAYLTGLSVTYVALLDRLIEIYKYMGQVKKVEESIARRESAREGLTLLTTENGYLIKSLDPDGTRHGVYGAQRYGYFEAVCNHDAMCFRVVDDEQARKIYNKIASIEGLRPYHFIITNYPTLDDMYETKSIFEFGWWVNGGAWPTCEARMMIGYYRVGAYEDARQSMKHLLSFAREFKLDDHYSNSGKTVSWYVRPIYSTYDSYGPPAALIRGLFEYLYKADRLILLPHIPDGITQLDQKFPIRFGTKKLYLSTAGSGKVTAVRVNGKKWKEFNGTSITLPYDKLPDAAQIQISLGGAKFAAPFAIPDERTIPELPAEAEPFWGEDLSYGMARQLQSFCEKAEAAGIQDGFEIAQAKLALEYIVTVRQRMTLLQEGKITRLAAEESQAAADESYRETARRLYHGLHRVITTYADSQDEQRKEMYNMWSKTKK